MKSFALKSLVLAGGLLFSLSALADMTGTWNLSVESPQGTSNPSLELTQDGENVTGTYTSSMLGEADVSGTEKDGEFNLTADVSAQGQVLTLTYTGKVDGDSLTGSLDLGGMGSADFTGTRE